MKKIVTLGVLCCVSLSTGQGMESPQQNGKLTIVGGGIVGFMEAWQGYLSGIKRINIYEKNASMSDTTTSHIVPSLAPDELKCALPRGNELLDLIELKYDQPGGILVDDLCDSEVTNSYFLGVSAYGKDVSGYKKSSQALLQLGQMGMGLWQKFYDEADDELRVILDASNFNPCREPRNHGKNTLHDGYRIDLLYNNPNAKPRAEGMKKTYEGLGYSNCKHLSPQEVIDRDPSLSYFCDAYAQSSNLTDWKDNAAAIWRPGGCIDTGLFLPKFHDYLKGKMGQYTGKNGELKDCFKLKLNRQVTDVKYINNSEKTMIGSLYFHSHENRSDDIKHNNDLNNNSFVFCPGEAVGTIELLGLKEPAYAAFLGVSLKLNIPLPEEMIKEYAAFSHCMEVHQEGIVLAWQARLMGEKMFIGVAGTKAFSSGKKPVNQDFETSKILLQLNIINDVFPNFISLALNRDTKGQKITHDDLVQLEKAKIANCWTGKRAVAYDGFPTLGKAYNSDSGKQVWNTRVTTHMGSGGVSASLAAVKISEASKNTIQTDSLVKKVLGFSDSKRTPPRNSRRIRDNYDQDNSGGALTGGLIGGNLHTSPKFDYPKNVKCAPSSFFFEK